MNKKRRSSVTSGITLIGIGLLLFWLNRHEDIGDSIVFFVIGSLFLAGYLRSRTYGLLIPGCLMLGLGAGTLLDRERISGDPVEVGIGAGFIAIFVIALVYEKRSHWWPLIPGGILLINAFAIGKQLKDFLFSGGGWPLVLVVIGVFILLGAIGGRGSRRDEA